MTVTLITRMRRFAAARAFPVEAGRAARCAVWLLGCAGMTLALPSGACAAAAAAPGSNAGATNTEAPAAAPAAKSAASEERAPAATPGASGGAGNSASSGTSNAASSGTNTSAPSTSGSAAPGSAPQAAQAQQPSQPSAAAKAPTQAPTQAPAGASAQAAAVPPPYYVSPQLRYGGYMVFRNLIPSPILEAQAAEEFGQIVYGAEHANRLYSDTDPHVTRVRSIVDRMIPYSLKWNERAKGWKWDLAVIRSNDIRMYCLPGGKIVIYGGLLDRVRLNDNELGMLIGHEIAHALREHARMRLGQLQERQLDSSGTIPQLFGLADLGMAPLGIGSRLLEMKYESTDETEADVIGSEIASRAGFDPRAAVTLWDKLALATGSSREHGFIYVHPYTPARREDIIKRLPDMLPLYAKAIGKSVDALPDYAGLGRPVRKQARN